MNKNSKKDIGTTLEFKFLSGQYHATEWGRNVNEGLIDWPPSPWRMLRAIISAWKTYANEIEDSKVRPIIEQMCKCKVSFRIPSAVQTHTRHYMPTRKSSEKVIDSFVMTDKDGCLYAQWDDLNLEEEQEETLEKIVSKIRYLGRAESWCKVRIAEQHKSPNCVLLDGDNSEGKDIIDVITPTQDATLEDLCMETRDIYKSKKSHPDKSRFVQYVREKDCFAHIQSTRKPKKTKVNMVRYMIVGNVRPRITETIKIGDMAKRSAMSIYGKSNNGGLSETLSGKDSNREISKGHRHAYYLPTDEDGDNVLDHITIIAKEPFDEKELGALNKMNKIRHYQNQFVDLVHEARGITTDFDKIPILESSKRWETVTPFVLNRHMKLKGSNRDIIVDGPEDQLRDEIRNRFGDKTNIRGLIIDDAKFMMRTGIKPIQFKRWRKDRLPGFGAYNVRIEFENDMSGPLSFGHGSHFGLGLFVPVK